MIRVRGDYIKRILLIASFILMGTVHVFAAQLGEGWLPVRLDDEIATAAPGRLTLRGRHEVLVYVAEPGPARVFVRSVRVGRYEDEVSVIVDDQQASGLAKLTLQPAERGTLEFEAPKRGLYRLVVETGLNAAEVIPETEGWVIPARQGQEIHSIFAAGPLYFFVPQDLRSFEVWGRGGGPNENVLLRVRRPDGSIHGEVVSWGSSPEVLSVEVPQGADGAVWTVELLRAPEGVIEDAYLWCSPEIAGVSTQAKSLSVPFLQGMERPPVIRSDRELALSFDWNAHPPAGAAELRFVLTDSTGEAVVQDQWAIAEPLSPVTWVLPSTLSNGSYALIAQLLDSDGQTIMALNTQVRLTSGVLYFGDYRPLVRGFLHFKEKGLPALIVRPEVDPILLADVRFVIEVSVSGISSEPAGPDRRILRRQSFEGLSWDGITVDFGDESPETHGLFCWQIETYTSEGQILDVQRLHLVQRYGVPFTESLESVPARPLPDQGGKAWRVFTPAAVEAIRYGYRPDEEDLQREPAVFATPGESVPFTMGVLAFSNVEALAVSVSDLTGPDKIIPAQVIDIHRAHYMAQRTNWNSPDFWIVPEVLVPLRDPDMPESRIRMIRSVHTGVPIPSATLSLAAFQQAQIWFTINVPEGTPAGVYEGEVVFEDSNGQTIRRPLRLWVLPFSLLQPSDRHWGLYTDSSRWEMFPEESVRAELEDFRKHGITGLVMYPLTHSTIQARDNKPVINSDKFAAYMKMVREVGLDGPIVMDFQGLRNRVSQLTGKEIGSPEFAEFYAEVIRHFAERGHREGWGEMVYHAVDEPSTADKARDARALLSIIKDIGLPTFTTANNVQMVNELLDDVLDVRTWYISFASSPSAAQTRQTEAQAVEGRFWCYGSGSYTGQEGRMLANRYITGLFLAKSGAEGMWSWTFQRPKDQPYDDFDGASHKEQKDAMITYPSFFMPTRSYPTLQWEGIREGVDDYRYIHTLRVLASEANRTDILDGLQRLLDEVPWNVRSLSAEEVEKVRARIVDWLLEIHE